MKSTLLVALTLFLVSAPAPDSNDIAEMTSNFIVPQSSPGLQAGEEPIMREMTVLTAKSTKTLSDESLNIEKSVQKKDEAKKNLNSRT